MGRVAIIETVMSQLVAEGRELLALLLESEQAAAVRRMELGRFLLKARKQLPKRGSREDGWGSFLEAMELDEATAYRYMKLAEATVGFTEKDKIPTYGELGLDKRIGPEPPTDAPALTDSDAPPDAGGELEVVIDRDIWCTPKDLAEAIGDWDLDPCANERSHVQAAREFRLEERGEDGLLLASKVDGKARVFINPPYSDVPPWIEAYAHTRFCFLLKLDPSTAWFERLFGLSEVVLIPRGTRVQFEAPPGVPAEKSKANPFPHALFYARASDATKAIRSLCFSPWRTK